MLAHGSTGPRMRGHAWGPLRREWIKLLFQRRSYLIWGGAVAIPFLIALAFYLAKSDPHGGEGPLFFQQVTGNGMFVALAALSALLPFLLPMAAAMVAGYMIAGEAELGTLRIVLLRPVRRGAVHPHQVGHGDGLPRRGVRTDAGGGAALRRALLRPAPDDHAVGHAR